MLLKEFKGKKLLILGFGKEGQDSFDYLYGRIPGARFGIADRKEQGEFPGLARKLKGKSANLHFGEQYLDALAEYDVVIKSPGIPTTLIKARKGQIILTQAGLFLELCPGTVIGVTGTKGKSTTASLIFSMLKAAEKQARLVGNIGEPSLKYLEKATKRDIFVYELSSFQLEHIRKSPAIAVFLNLYPEHLDHHGTMKKYAEAKSNIFRFQNSRNVLIYNAKDPAVNKLAQKAKARKAPFDPEDPAFVSFASSRMFAASVVPAVFAARALDVPDNAIKKGIRSFRPLPHRMEKIGEWKGISFYNDSLATIPHATVRALDLLKGNVGVLILGGYDRGIPFEPLAASVVKHEVPAVVLLPDTGSRIWEAIQKETKKKKKQLPRALFASSMEDAVKLCYAHAPSGTACLLSPASSSFNMFRDYKERGEKFAALAKHYGSNPKA